MLKLENYLFKKLNPPKLTNIIGGASEVQVGEPTKGYPGGSYSEDCVIDTDCGDGTTGADVARGSCCN